MEFRDAVRPNPNPDPYRKGNKEENSLRHVAMVAKFLDDNKPINVT